MKYLVNQNYDLVNQSKLNSVEQLIIAQLTEKIFFYCLLPFTLKHLLVSQSSHAPKLQENYPRPKIKIALLQSSLSEGPLLVSRPIDTSYQSNVGFTLTHLDFIFACQMTHLDFSYVSTPIKLSSYSTIHPVRFSYTYTLHKTTIFKLFVIYQNISQITWYLLVPMKT